MTKPVNTVCRLEFIQNLVKNSGFTYVQANAAFESFVKTIEDGICSGSRINLAKIGSLNPVTLPPRPVSMNFRKKKGGEIEKSHRLYYLGTRVKYKFSLFKGFQNSHKLRWLEDVEVPE